MRILWNAHRDPLNPSAGGAERTIEEIGRRIVNAGHELHLLAGGFQGASRHEVFGGIVIHRYPGMAFPHFAAPSLIRHLAPSVIIDDLAHIIPWGSPWFSRNLGIAVFRHLHTRVASDPASPKVLKALCQLEKTYESIYRHWTFVTETKSSQRDLAALGVPISHVRVIPPGVDTSTFIPRRRSPTPSMVFFGGLRPYKHPEYALQVVRILHDIGIDVVLNVVGEGVLLPRMRQLAKQLGVERSVKFWGRLPRQLMPEVVGAAWVNLNCSVVEGWGYSITEAAACGVPTVAFSVPGVSEAVRACETGITVETGDISGLADAVRLVLESPERWRGPCRRSAEQRNWDVAAREWLEVIVKTKGVG